MSSQKKANRPNILLITTDELRDPPGYETDEVKRWRKKVLKGEQSLRDGGITFGHHYIMSAACTPSRASYLTGQYPSMHGVTQTDGLAKSPESPDMFWLDPNGAPTMGDYFRAGGYRTYYKGKWHASHPHLEDPDGNGYLLSIDDKGKQIPENIKKYLKADLLDEYGFSEWVGPDPHGIGRHNTGTMKDKFTADEVIELLQRFDKEKNDQPWLAVCSFLNPHDICLYGVVALMQGLRYHTKTIPNIPEPPSRKEDMSTKPACQQSYNEAWGTIFAPQKDIELERKFYYQLLAEVDSNIARVLEALHESKVYENTIVIFTADHGELLAAHGGMHEKWHNAYEETVHVPFVVSSPLFEGAPRTVDALTSHADLLPTMLGLAGIDQTQARAKLGSDHDARPLLGRDLSPLILGTDADEPSDPVLFMTDDEISEGSAKPGSPFMKLSKGLGTFQFIKQPNHIETVVARVDVNNEQHLVKLSRYHDNEQFWTFPGESDKRLHKGKKFEKVTEPAPDEYELYDLTLDPYEQRNLAHPGNANDGTRKLQETMFGILVKQLEAKRLVPKEGEVPGYRLPKVAVQK
jgi:arylsulfatase A-like enzyme